MKYEEIEPRIDELEEVSKPIVASLEKARVDLAESQSDLRFTKQLGDIENFILGLLKIAKEQASQEELVHSLVNGLGKIQEYVRGESLRIRERVPAMRERVAVLESLGGFVEDRKRSHSSRKEAIERVSAEEGETKRPERLPVVREAERLRKNRKQDDS